MPLSFGKEDSMTILAIIFIVISMLELGLLISYRHNIVEYAHKQNQVITNIILNEDILDASIKQISEVYGIDEEELIDILTQHRSNI